MKKLSAKIWVLGFMACFALSFSSCKIKRLHTERNFEEKIVYIETVHDTTIHIPADSSALIALFECDSLNKVVLKELSELRGTRSTVDARIESSDEKMYVYVDCICDSLDIYLTYKDRYYTESSKAEVNKKDVVQENIKPNRWNWLFSGFVVGLIMCFILLLLYVFFKLKIRSWIK